MQSFEFFSESKDIFKTYQVYINFQIDLVRKVSFNM